LPGLVEADDDGLYVVKFRGAAQGPRALVAEVIAGELGRAIGLPVPELVFVQIEPGLTAEDPDPDPFVQELLERSPGLNLGVDYLPGSLTFSPSADGRPEPTFAADVVWFDSLVTNTDRSTRNPNILAWHHRLYLIDHGAALYIHHTWRNPDDHAVRPLPTIGDHVLLPGAASIADAHRQLAPRVTDELLMAVIDAVPDSWLIDTGAIDDPRAAYGRYLRLRRDANASLSRELDEVARAS
jgi:HipA-like kinase